MTTINLMPHEQNHAFATTSKLPFLNEERLKVVGAERLSADVAPLLDSRRARYKLDVFGIFDHVALFSCGHGLH